MSSAFNIFYYYTNQETVIQKLDDNTYSSNSEISG